MPSQWMWISRCGYNRAIYHSWAILWATRWKYHQIPGGKCGWSLTSWQVKRVGKGVTLTKQSVWMFSLFFPPPKDRAKKMLTDICQLRFQAIIHFGNTFSWKNTSFSLLKPCHCHHLPFFCWQTKIIWRKKIWQVYTGYLSYGIWYAMLWISRRKNPHQTLQYCCTLSAWKFTIQSCWGR